MPQKEEEKYICPHCGEHITSLDYQAPQIDYGTFWIESGDWDSDRSDNEGDTTYRCPECNETINNIDELEIYKSKEEKEKEEKEKQKPLTEKNKLIEKFNNTEIEIKNGNFYKCPKCKTEYELDRYEEQAMCKCGTIIRRNISNKINKLIQ